MNSKKEQDKREQFQKNQIPAIRNKQEKVLVVADDDKAILCLSAKNFTELLHALESKFAGKKIKQIHAFNSELAGLGDKYDLTPEEMLCALTLLAKYIVMHSNLSGGVRVNHDVPLWALPYVVDRLSKGDSSLLS